MMERRENLLIVCKVYASGITHLLAKEFAISNNHYTYAFILPSGINKRSWHLYVLHSSLNAQHIGSVSFLHNTYENRVTSNYVNV